MAKPRISGRKIYNMLVSEGCSCHTREDVMRTQTSHDIQEALDLSMNRQPGGLSLEDVSIRDLAANLILNRDGTPVGDSFVQEYMNPMHEFDWQRLSEAGGSMSAVNYAAFSGITGQLVINRVLDSATSEDFIASRMITTQSTPFESERIPGVAVPQDPDKDGFSETTEVGEGEEYKTVGFGEEYIQTPTTRKYGLIIPVTREAIFFDRTGLISRRAADVGNLIGLRKEKRILKVMIGASDNIRFVEKRQFDGAPVTMDLFQYASGTGAYQLAGDLSARKYPFANDIPANAFVDYTSIRKAEQYFDNTIDPNTGEPIIVGKPFVFMTKNRELDILQVLQAENIWKATQYGMATAGALTNATAPIMTSGGNVLARLPGGVQFQVSRQLRNQLVAFLQTAAGGSMNASDAATAADKIWFYGDPQKAFVYMENWPITVTQAPPSSEAEFQQDIIMRYKASERGTVSIEDARAWQRHNFQSTAS